MVLKMLKRPRNEHHGHDVSFSQTTGTTPVPQNDDRLNQIWVEPLLQISCHSFVTFSQWCTVNHPQTTGTTPVPQNDDRWPLSIGQLTGSIFLNQCCLQRWEVQQNEAQFQGGKSQQLKPSQTAPGNLSCTKRNSTVWTMRNSTGESHTTASLVNEQARGKAQSEQRLRQEVTPLPRKGN